MQKLARTLLTHVCSFCSVQEHFHTVARINKEFKSIAHSGNPWSFPPSTPGDPHVLFKKIALGAIARGFRPNHLVIAGSLVTKQDFKILSRVNNLKLLKLSTSFGSKSFQIISANHSLLETLVFYEDEGCFDDISSKHLKYLAKCKNLTQLDIRHCGELKSSAVKTLQQFQYLQLKCLDFLCHSPFEQTQELYTTFAARKMPLTEVGNGRQVSLDCLASFPLKVINRSFETISQVSEFQNLYSSFSNLTFLTIYIDTRCFSKINFETMGKFLGQQLERLRISIEDDEEKFGKELLQNDDLKCLSLFPNLFDLAIYIPYSWSLNFFASLSRLKKVRYFTFNSKSFTMDHVKLLGRDFVERLEFLDLDRVARIPDLRILNSFKKCDSVYLYNYGGNSVVIEDIIEKVTDLPIGCVMDMIARTRDSVEWLFYCIINTKNGWKISSDSQWKKDRLNSNDERRVLTPAKPIGDIPYYSYIK